MELAFKIISTTHAFISPAALRKNNYRRSLNMRVFQCTKKEEIAVSEQQKKD